VFHAVYGILCCKVYKLNKFIWTGEKLPQECNAYSDLMGIKVYKKGSNAITWTSEKFNSRRKL